MPVVDLGQFVSGGVGVLIGQDRGVAVRTALNLDTLDVSSDVVRVRIPTTLRTLTPSFVQGLLSGSVHRLGEEKFYQHYKFDATDQQIDDIRAGVDRVLTSRHLAGIC